MQWCQGVLPGPALESHRKSLSFLDSGWIRRRALLTLHLLIKAVLITSLIMGFTILLLIIIMLLLCSSKIFNNEHMIFEVSF